jgi:hypothetical protein
MVSIRDDAYAVVAARRAESEEAARRVAAGVIREQAAHDPIRLLGREYVAEILDLGGRPSRAIDAGRLVDGEYLPAIGWVYRSFYTGPRPYLVRVGDGELFRWAGKRASWKRPGPWQRRRLRLADPVFLGGALVTDLRPYPEALALTVAEVRNMFTSTLTAALEPANWGIPYREAVRAMGLPMN